MADSRTLEFMSRLRARVAEMDALQCERWQSPQKPQQRAKSRQSAILSPSVWYESQPVPTARKKMFLPRRMTENWSTQGHKLPRHQAA